MNRYTISIFLASLLAVPVALAADEEDRSAHHPDAGQQQAAPAQDDKAAGMKMEKMQEKMKKMREQMEKIHSAKDPAERQKLMEEHMQSMQEGMKMMGGMGAGMKGGDRMAKARKDQPESMTDAGHGIERCMMMKKQKSVDSRMDMMQQMMEQMMEHESAEQEMERGR